MADLNTDINKYLRGELTPAEMHALEERALRDPFLADALEGAAQITPEKAQADLENLQHLLQKRIQDKRGKEIAFWVWPARIAAGLLLLVLSTVVIINLTTRKSDDSLALNNRLSPAAENEDVKEDFKEEPKTTPSPSAIEKDDGKLPVLRQADETASTQGPAVQSQKDISSPPSPAIEKELSPTTADVKADDEEVNDALAAGEETVEPATPAGALKKSEARRFSVREDESKQKDAAGAASVRPAQDAVLSKRIARGQVKSANGVALPGVNVMIKGTNLGTITDSGGNYQISLGQDHSGLVFSHIGFASVELQTVQEARSDIQLHVDDSQRAEVVVAGETGDRAQDNSMTSPYEMTTPVGGRQAFKQYLEKNLRYPEEALKKKVEGSVTIQFAVDRSGKRSDYVVIKSIGSGCDEEVIRLIRQGPAWMPAKRNNETTRDIVKVMMKFELPEK